MNARLVTAAAFALSIAGAMGSFVLTTVTMDVLPDAVTIGAALVVAFAVVAAGVGRPVLGRLRGMDRATLGRATAGGALAFWAAPFLALTQRGTSAPSGADTLFFTTVLWGGLVVLGAQFVASERTAFTGSAGAVCSAAGAAGLLASWEYPSSFSPFAKFPVREALMLVAGVLFAVGVVALSQAARRAGARSAATLGLGGAAVLGVLAGLPGLPALASAGMLAARPVALLGAATAVFAGALTWTVSRVGAARASASLLLVPVGMTMLAAYEQVTHVYGVNPFEMRGVLSGSAIVVTGAAVTWLSAPEGRDSAAPHGLPSRLALWIAAGSCALGAASLVTPALNAVSEGHVSSSFRVAWTMLGFESAAGWMTAAAALLALTAALEARRGGAARSWLVASCAVVACAIATLFVSATTLHTWNTWIPAEVQQTYGTEYARFAVSAVVDPVRVAALALAVVSAGMLGYAAVRSATTGRSEEAGS